jgi:hypothetical protein
VTVAGQVVAGSAGLPRLIRWLGVPAIGTMIPAEACMMFGRLKRCGVPEKGSASA